MKKLVFSFILSTLYIVYIYAQEYNYGKVSLDLLNLKECDFEKEASAMITFKSGNYKISFSENEGFKLVCEFKKQIKIFDKEAKDIGTFVNYFYCPVDFSSKTKMIGIKGKTYNLVNGKITETKLKDENIIEEQYNNYLKRVTISMPNLQENCVFEFEYKLVSDAFNFIEDYYLQEKFPIAFNEFKTSFPEFFIFQINVLGGIIHSEDKHYSSEETVIFKITEDNLTRRTSSMERFDIKYNNREIKFKRINSYVSEPFVANEIDNIGKIQHQMVLIKWPNRPVENIASDYTTLSKNLLEFENFGKVIRNGKFLEKMLVLNDSISQKEKGQKILNYFIENVKWDNSYNYRSDKNGKKLLKERRGDSGDINLNYIAALNEYGIATFPVILSSRGNGTLHPTYPSYKEFDYVVAVSLIDDKFVFSDATADLPFGQLPVRALNGKGWIVDDQNGRWIDLVAEKKGQQMIQTDISLNDNNAKYLCKIVRKDYFAYEDNETIKKSSIENYLEKFMKTIGYSADTVYVTENSPAFIKLSGNYSVSKIFTDDIIYIQPFINLPFDSNPFVKTDRKANIDFPYLTDYKYVSYIKKPDAYEFEFPESLNISTLGNAASFSFSSFYNAAENMLSLNCNFKINSVFFLSSDYSQLKDIFEKMINKMLSPIVLKKKQ